MNSEGDKLWYELASIQASTIGKMVSQTNQYCDLKELLTDFSYDIIYHILELIDGYHNKSIKYSIKNVITNEIVNSNVDLHNFCETHLKCTDK